MFPVLPTKWFCRALALTVFLVQLETASPLECYECYDTTCDNAAGIPSPNKTCTGDVCYTLFEDFNNVIKYQSCGEFSYFTQHLRNADADVRIGYCSYANGTHIQKADGWVTGGPVRPYQFGASDHFQICSCAMNDLCNVGGGAENATYGHRRVTNDGTPPSLSNFVLGGVIVVLVAVKHSTRRLFGF